MSLLRTWLILLSLVAGLGIALAILAPRGVGEELDRELDTRLERTQHAAALLLRVNARKWIDTSAQVASDAVLIESLDQATRGPADLQLVHKTVQDRLRYFNERMKVDLVLATDARGRVIARVGLDAPVYKDGVEGYPLVADALRGLRGDDTWSVGGKLYRVAASPVIQRDRYVGSVVIGQEAQGDLAESMKGVLGTEVVLLLRGRVIASTAPLSILDRLPTVAAKHAEELGRSARSSAVTLDGWAIVFGSFVGEASEHQALFALCSPRHVVPTLPQLLVGLARRDLSTLPWRALLPIAVGTLVALVLGLILVGVFASRPLERLANDAQALSRGEVQRLPEANHTGTLGVIARSINSTLERLLGRARAEVRAAMQPVVQPPEPRTEPRTEPRSEPRPVPQETRPTGVKIPPLPRIETPAPLPEPTTGGDSPLVGGRADFDERKTHARDWLPASPSPGLFTQSLTPLPPPMVSGETSPGPMGPTADLSSITANELPALPPDAGAPLARPFEEPTSVESPSEALLLASAHGTSDELEVEFRRVFDEFVSTRQQCGEPMEGVTFDKFVVKLRHNRAQLIQRYGCANVRFQVYIKDGKTALKATPVT